MLQSRIKPLLTILSSTVMSYCLIFLGFLATIFIELLLALLNFIVKIVDSGLYFYYIFFFYFYFYFIFLFLEHRVRVRSHNTWKEVEGSGRMIC